MRLHLALCSAAPIDDSIGKSGTPVTRSKTKTNPCFVVWATASMTLPLRRTRSSVGGEGKSRSQMSCLTAWKCQSRLPVWRRAREGCSQRGCPRHGWRRRNRLMPNRWDIDNAALLVERHARPVIRRASVGPRIGRPRVVTQLSGSRDSVKGPPQRARQHIVGANISGGCWKALAMSGRQRCRGSGRQCPAWSGSLTDVRDHARDPGEDQSDRRGQNW